MQEARILDRSFYEPWNNDNVGRVKKLTVL